MIPEAVLEQNMDYTGNCICENDSDLLWPKAYHLGNNDQDDERKNARRRDTPSFLDCTQIEVATGMGDFMGLVALALQNIMLYRRLLMTEQGYIGMAPAEVRKADRVCLLLGCRVSVLLRKHEEGEYELVGDVYVHGIMNGRLRVRRKLEDYEIHRYPVSGSHPHPDGSWFAVHLTHSPCTHRARKDGLDELHECYTRSQKKEYLKPRR